MGLSGALQGISISVIFLPWHCDNSRYPHTVPKDKDGALTRDPLCVLTRSRSLTSDGCHSWCHRNTYFTALFCHRNTLQADQTLPRGHKQKLHSPRQVPRRLPSGTGLANLDDWSPYWRPSLKPRATLPDTRCLRNKTLEHFLREDPSDSWPHVGSCVLICGPSKPVIFQSGM